MRIMCSPQITKQEYLKLSRLDCLGSFFLLCCPLLNKPFKSLAPKHYRRFLKKSISSPQIPYRKQDHSTKLQLQQAAPCLEITIDKSRSWFNRLKIYLISKMLQPASSYISMNAKDRRSNPFWLHIFQIPKVIPPICPSVLPLMASVINL